MSFLFRVQRAHGADDRFSLLGYEWIEVLAIEPWALSFPGKEYGDWCDRVISSHYICLTPSGLTRIGAHDFWAAFDDYEEYDSATKDQSMSGYVITTGDASVVQVGATTHGNVQTSRDHYSADVVGSQGAGSRGKVAISWLPPDASLDDLRDELAELRTVLRSRAKAVSEDVEVAVVGEAEVAASQGDERKVLAVLRKAGRWSLTAAQEVGLEIAAAAITKGIGAG